MQPSRRCAHSAPPGLGSSIERRATMILHELPWPRAFFWALMSSIFLALLTQPDWWSGGLATRSIAGVELSAAGIAGTDDNSGIDGDGFVQRWLVLAPIPFAANESASDAFNRKQINDEASLTPKATERAKAGDKELFWKR